MSFIKLHKIILLSPWQDFPEYTSEELNNLIEHFNETVEALELVDPKNPKTNYDKNGKNVSQALPRSNGGQLSLGAF
jgi:hypothetical protein